MRQRVGQVTVKMELSIADSRLIRDDYTVSLTTVDVLRYGPATKLQQRILAETMLLRARDLHSISIVAEDCRRGIGKVSVN